ncbi:MAG: OmpA family protein [Leptospira sp.]|nr:OmpA family protein [Leptospira sp.]
MDFLPSADKHFSNLVEAVYRYWLLNLLFSKKPSIFALSYFVFYLGYLSVSSNDLQAQAKKLEWKLSPRDVLELNEFHDVKFRVPGQEVRRQDKNRIVLLVEDCSVKSCRIDSRFDTYVRYGNLKGPFRKEQTFESKFFIQKNGLYTVPDEYAVPNLRSVPGFPDHEVEPGDSWSMPAEESFDFNGARFKIPVKAEYTSFGNKEWSWDGFKGRGEKIHYSYPIFYQNPNPSSANLPVKVYGMARGVVYFDAEQGVPQYKDIKLSYTFVYRDGRITEGNFHINGVYQYRKKLTDVAKNELGDKVRKQLGVSANPDDSKSDNPINVRNTEEGISISMDSILFDTDKYDLKEKAIQQLGKIAKVLEQHPDREIRISGHTDNQGGSDYNLKLSENRAKSVLDSLVKKYNLESNRLSYQGYGDTKPIASNKTEDGRKQNRRVDITIVLE